jgi:hypothetical protein
MNATITRICRDCSVGFSITPEEQEKFAKKKLAIPTRCPDCREKGKRVEYVTCVDCGKVFGMNQLEIEWYQRQGMYLPKRCAKCRKERREANRNESYRKDRGRLHH